MARKTTIPAFCSSDELPIHQSILDVVDAVAEGGKQNLLPDEDSLLSAMSKSRKSYFKRINEEVVDLTSKEKLRKYACKHLGCYYTTAYPKDLKRHSRIHSGEQPYQCGICKRRFNRSDKLKVHERLHVDLQTFSCTKCNFTMSSSRSFKKHMRSHAEEVSYRSECPTLTGECQYFVVNVNPETVPLLSLPSDENVGNSDMPLKSNSETDRIENAAGRPILMPSNSDLGNSERLKKFACNYINCPFISAYKKDLTRHLRIHSGEQPFECGICKRRFNRSDKLKVHERSHSGDTSVTPKLKKFVCHHADCQYASAYRKDLRRHMRVHSAEHIFQCGTCKRKFKHADTLKLHERSHFVCKPYNSLSECSESDPNSLKKFCASAKMDTISSPVLPGDEMVKIASDEEQNFTPNDALQLSANSNVVEHVLTTVETPGIKQDMDSKSEMAKKYLCYYSKCTFASAYRKDLTRHLRIHSGEQPFQCTTCNKKFNRLDNLKLHQQVCLCDKPFRCDKCNYSTCYSKNFKKHLIEVHCSENPDIVTPQSCDIPGASAVDDEQDSMTNKDPEVTSAKKPVSEPKKVRRKFKEPKRYACDYSGCQFVSAYKKDLVRHLRVHSGEKPYECRTCKRKFNRSDKLKLHERTHTGDKPYSRDKRAVLTEGSSASIYSEENPYRCHKCPYTCCYTDQLYDHLKAHTEKVVYSCQLCQCKFDAITDLEQHELLHKDDEQFECSACNYKCTLKGNLKMHLSLKHRNKHQCELCTFSSPSQKAFYHHMKSHDTKWFPCPHTGCVFTGKSRQALRLHFFTHKEEKQPC